MNLYTQINKISTPGLDHQYYYDRITSYPEYEWFVPTNKHDQDYNICCELAMQGLIEKMISPIWTNEGLFRGYKTSFRYKMNLLYIT